MFALKGKNTIAIILTIVAIIVIVGGIILGCTQGYTEYEMHSECDAWMVKKFSIEIASIWWGGSIGSGLLLLAFAEIINLLEAIKNK
ncbi:MAG: hypothetical protein IKU84_01905 [Clostridia bacterium]|nr:hypothetical protein [Clostridia bacterium]